MNIIRIKDKKNKKIIQFNKNKLFLSLLEVRILINLDQVKSLREFKNLYGHHILMIAKVVNSKVEYITIIESQDRVSGLNLLILMDIMTKDWLLLRKKRFKW